MSHTLAVTPCRTYGSPKRSTMFLNQKEMKKLKGDYSTSQASKAEPMDFCYIVLVDSKESCL